MLNLGYDCDMEGYVTLNLVVIVFSVLVFNDSSIHFTLKFNFVCLL